MKILRRYTLKELIAPFLLTLLIFTFFLIGFNVLIKLVDLIINKGVKIVFVAKLFLYLLPYLLTFTLPMSILIAVLLVFGRLSSDNEITAISAGGINLYQIIVPVIVVGVLLSLASVVLNDKMASRAHFAHRRTIRQIAFDKPAAYLEPGKDIRCFQKYIIFIHEIKGDELFNIKVWEPQGEGKPARLILARKGEFSTSSEKGEVVLKLIDGSSDEPNPRDPARFYKANFKTYNLVLNLDEGLSQAKIDKKLRDMTIQELRRKAEELQSAGIEPREPIAEIHHKLSLSFASLTFILIGMPLGIKIRRREKSVNLGISLGLITAYWILLALGKTLAIRGILPGVSLWLPNIALGGLGFYLILRVVKE